MIFSLAQSNNTSLARSANRSVAKIETGISKNRVERESTTGAIITVIPSMRNIFAILDPRTFPMAISVFPDIAARSETIISGILVPIATIVSQIIASEIFHFFARDTAPSTRRFPPTVRSMSPRTIAPREIRISIKYMLNFVDYIKSWMNARIKRFERIYKIHRLPDMFKLNSPYSPA